MGDFLARNIPFSGEISEDQFSVTGITIVLSVKGNAGQLANHQFAGGVDDATCAEMSADGT